jgi:hypothetical protein
MSSKQPHKHAELIKRWADDPSLIVEYKYEDKWLIEPSISWNENLEYRIKPEVIRYRNVLYQSGNYYYVCAENENSGGSGGGIGLFIKYLTDWIEVGV